MDILAAIHQRFSVRSYADRPVAPALLERLVGSAEDAQQVTSVRPRVTLIEGRNAVDRILTFMVGSYGLVQNAPYLLAGIVPEESETARIDLGYVLEQVVLEATRLGLGTCWITGSYDAQQAGDVVSLGSDEEVAAVCALGYPTEEGFGRLHTKLIRRLAGGHKRKPLTSIVYSEDWKQPWSPEDADPALVTILNHSRLAPSAHNGQPWRFIVRSGTLALALMRPRFIDAGIVMSHVSLAAAAADRPGEWTLRLRDDALAREYGLPRRAIPIGTFPFSGA
jgi:nitroreductase